MNEEAAPRSPRGARVLVGALIAVGAGAVGWAGATVLTPAQDVLESTEFTFVEVAPGEIGASITLNTVAEWTPVPVGANQAAGVVTTVEVGPGDEVAQGDVLYTVGLRPVVIAEGKVPAYRAIAQGASGADVAQLQELLIATGHYAGAVDGSAGWSTVAAVRDWQESLGLERSGVVGFGDVLFVPSLPTRVALDAELVTRGASLSGGEEVVQGLPAAPSFRVPVTDAQARMMPLGTRVEIDAGADGWDGVVVEQESDPMSGSVNVTVEGADGAVLCWQECGDIPVTGEVLLTSRIVTVETVTGLVLPSAALVTGADGRIVAVDEAGVEHPVTVVDSARGMSVIEGLEAGFRARVPATGS